MPTINTKAMRIACQLSARRWNTWRRLYAYWRAYSPEQW